MSRAYYNEFDPKAAAWLRELIANGYLPLGDVDERSIEDVTPNDLRPYTQCHFFAGIGGWPAALKWLSGWPDDRPVWTGSCPCQPFSQAGQGKGVADERHLWPAWAWLIDECRPPVVFGEQVASKDGRAWFSVVQADLEGMGYAAAAADICAAGVGAPHWRQRLWFVGLADADIGGEGMVRGSYSGLDQRQEGLARLGHWGGGSDGRLADGDDTGSQGRGRAELPERADERAFGAGGSPQPELFASALDGPWRDADWLLCTDGKWRPVEPGTFPLAHGVPDRVGLLRGYGNAIVPQVAAEFIQAVEEAVNT